MPGKVTLTVVEGAQRGKEFAFSEHDTFLFGRMEDCHVGLPEDRFVSRYHFILEANPPEARIRDLGSLNGTYVNGTRYGGRERGETPEEGAKRKYPEVDLHDGDEIKVGATVFRVAIAQPVLCADCGSEVPEDARGQARQSDGTFICPACQEKRRAPRPRPPAPEPVRCQRCGKEVAAEAGQAPHSEYLCQECRRQVQEDPSAVFAALLRQLLQPEAPLSLSIPDYQIEKELGKGGMGAVYLARHKRTGEPVAVKVMLPRVAVQEQARTKFMREIDVMRALRHPNIVELYDHGSAGGVFYCLMEFCAGGSADRLMARRGGRLELAEAGPIILQALAGLAYAHEQGYVHRDLKPQNILLSGREGDWTAKVADMGLSKNFEEAGLSGHTVTGQYAGTAPFMPREQVINFRFAKPVTDVWAMGATLYNMLTGQYPYQFTRGEDPIQVILQGRIVPIRDRKAGIPRKVEEVIDRSLAVNPKDRYQNGGELLKALRRAL
ncbi:MAG: FHA domain-containing serine/threonine-protein kinase [Anaerolineae bacterium]|nr:FHA domain-containing serine/threonine-protein kinase [Anaerolineae bacterium]